MPKQDYYERGQLTDLVYLVLLTLMKPKHGYLMMSEVEALTGGAVKIGPATLYTTVKRLLEHGYIALTGQEEKKKTYQITPAGLDMLTAEIEKRKKLVDYGLKAFRAYEIDCGGADHGTV